jgi:hypothetical protein
MRRRDLIVGIVIILVLAGAVYLWQTRRQDLQVPDLTPTPSAQQEIEERFNVVIPEDAEKVQLRDTRGQDATAIATRSTADDTFRVTVLASLETPAGGGFYQGWIIRGEEGDENYSVLSLGRLSVAKGGFVVDFESSQDYSDYQKIVVTQEVVADNEMEEVVLEGNF